jgi:hypothetical protein
MRGAQLVNGSEAEEALGAGARGAAPVVSEHRLVEVDGYVLGREAPHGGNRISMRMRIAFRDYRSTPTPKRCGALSRAANARLPHATRR